MKINDERNFDSKTPEEKYEFLKQLQGELKAFYLKLRAKLNSEGN
jgi:phosphate:Na+ symporter